MYVYFFQGCLSTICFIKIETLQVLNRVLNVNFVFTIISNFIKQIIQEQNISFSSTCKIKSLDLQKTFMTSNILFLKTF